MKKVRAVKFQRAETGAIVYLMALTLLAFTGFMISFASNTNARSKRTTQKEFLEFRKLHPNEIFAAGISPKVKKCISAFQARQKLPNGIVYGDSARRYSLKAKTPEKVKEDMARLNCILKEDVLREPIKNEPLIFQGHTIPLWAFLCPDGGVIRIKPQGDPTSSYRPQPHGSKSLRFPYDSKFENFTDEIVKVDDEGNAIPKSRADLAAMQFVDGWADDGHVDLETKSR